MRKRRKENEKRTKIYRRGRKEERWRTKVEFNKDGGGISQCTVKSLLGSYKVAGGGRVCGWKKQ